MSSSYSKFTDSNQYLPDSKKDMYIVDSNICLMK